MEPDEARKAAQMLHLCSRKRIRAVESLLQLFPIHKKDTEELSQMEDISCQWALTVIARRRNEDSSTALQSRMFLGAEPWRLVETVTND